MRLNQAKTEVLSFNTKGAGIRFANGKLIPRKTEVDYLGAKLNANGDPNKEHNSRKILLPKHGQIGNRFFSNTLIVPMQFRNN